MSFVKGMAVGLVVGTGIGVLVELSPSHRKNSKRMLNRCVKNIGNVVEGVSCALGL